MSCHHMTCDGTHHVMVHLHMACHHVITHAPDTFLTVIKILFENVSVHGHARTKTFLPLLLPRHVFPGLFENRCEYESIFRMIRKKSGSKDTCLCVFNVCSIEFKSQRKNALNT